MFVVGRCRNIASTGVCMFVETRVCLLGFLNSGTSCIHIESFNSDKHQSQVNMVYAQERFGATRYPILTGSAGHINFCNYILVFAILLTLRIWVVKETSNWLQETALWKCLYHSLCALTLEYIMSYANYLQSCLTFCNSGDVWFETRLLSKWKPFPGWSVKCCWANCCRHGQVCASHTRNDSDTFLLEPSFTDTGHTSLTVWIPVRVKLFN